MGGEINFVASRDRTTDLAVGGGGAFLEVGEEKFCGHPGSNHQVQITGQKSSLVFHMLPPLKIKLNY